MNMKPLSGKQPWVDPDDAPELTKEFFERAALYDGEKLIRPGRIGRPKSAAPKRLTTLRIDAAVLAAFRATGPGWQTRMNRVLRDHLAQRGKQTKRSAVGRGAAAGKWKLVAKRVPKQLAAAGKVARLLPPVHPGVVLADELEARGLTVKALAVELHVSPDRLSEVVHGRKAISADTALRLEHYLGTDSTLWLNLQTQYDLAVLQRDHGEQIAREVVVATVPKPIPRRARSR